MASRDATSVRVRCYTRVSTEEQAQSGYSLAAQRQLLQSYIDRMGWLCVGWYVDEGKSAKDLNRPEFQRMMKETQPNEVVLVTKLDRLTRSVRDLDELLRTFEKRDLVFQSATEQFETRTPGGRLYMGIVAVIAQWEREIIADRSAAGKKQKVVEGEWAGGPIPFGYISVPSGKYKRGRELLRLVPDPERAHIVAEIFRRYVGGQGVRALCIWLNDEARVLTTNGARWRVSSLTRLLTNAIYAGFVTHGRSRRKDIIRVPGTHEAIVPLDLFEQTQTMFEIRKTMTPRQATGMYPLSGIAKCGVCGGRMDVAVHRDKGFYSYRCRQYANGVGCGDGTEKANSGIYGHIIESRLLKEIQRLSETDQLDRLMKAYEEENERKAGISAAEIKRLEGVVTEAQRVIRRWEKVFEDGKIEWDELQERTREHKERLQGASAELGRVSELPALPSRSELASFTLNMQLAWDHLTPPERKAMIQEFVHAFRMDIVVFPDRRVELVPTS